MRRVMTRATWVAVIVVSPGCSDPETATRASEVSYVAPAGVKSATVQGALDELAAQQAANGDLAGRTDALEGSVVGLTQKVDSHGEALAGLPERVMALEQAPPPGAEVIAASGPGATVQGALTSLDSATQSLDARMTALEGALAAAEAAAAVELAAAQGRIDALEARVEALESDAATRDATLGALEGELNAKWKAPRPCPEGLIAVSTETCIEPTLRPADYSHKALSACRKADLRLCRGDEVMEVCGRGWIDEIQDTVGFTPEWSADIVARVLFSEPEEIYQGALGAIGGGGSCDYSYAASTSKMAPGTTTVKFPYRCCASR